MIDEVPTQHGSLLEPYEVHIEDGIPDEKGADENRVQYETIKRRDLPPLVRQSLGESKVYRKQTIASDIAYSIEKEKCQYLETMVQSESLERVREKGMREA